jgi:hypothetical protein
MHIKQHDSVSNFEEVVINKNLLAVRERGVVVLVMDSYDTLLSDAVNFLCVGRQREFSVKSLDELSAGSERYHTQGTGYIMRLTDDHSGKPRYVYFGALNAGFDANEGNLLATVAEHVVAIAVPSSYVLESGSAHAFDGRFPNLEAVNLEGADDGQLKHLHKMLTGLGKLRVVKLPATRASQASRALFAEWQNAPSGNALNPDTQDIPLKLSAPRLVL